MVLGEWRLSLPLKVDLTVHLSDGPDHFPIPGTSGRIIFQQDLGFRKGYILYQTSLVDTAYRGWGGGLGGE